MLSSSSFVEICITAINHTSLKLCAKSNKGKKHVLTLGSYQVISMNLAQD